MSTTPKAPTEFSSSVPPLVAPDIIQPEAIPTGTSAAQDVPSNNGPLPVVPERLPSDQVRISVVRAIAAWGFGAAFFNVTAGAIYAAFVRSLSTSDFLFGALASALPLTSFLQVMAARMVERSGRRKRLMVVCGLIGRSLWLVSALLPLLWTRFPHSFSKSGTFTLILICVATSGVFQAFTGPAFFSWMADLVPERVRPAFFARRMQVGTLTALLVSILAGLIADNFQKVSWITQHFQPLEIYCFILAIAAVCGVIDIAMFIGVKEPPSSSRLDENGAFLPAEEIVQPPLLASLREPLRDRGVRNFLLFVSLLMAGYGIQGAFLWLHALEYLHLSKTVTGIVVNGMPLLGIACGMPFWSSVIKRYGTRPVMRFCSVGIIFI
ncbi:MAG: MFS transporter, partial [Abitibacteriaceae bacterium]|nr:MFS transporter [Abditibacteriaceae bacterium]